MLSVRVSCQPTSLPAPLALSSSSSSISLRSSARRSLSAWVKRDHSNSALTTYCVKGIKESKNRYAHYVSNLFCGALVGLKYVSLSRARDKYFPQWKNKQWRGLLQVMRYVPALRLARRELWHTSMFLLTTSFCFFLPLKAPQWLPPNCSSPASSWPTSNASVKLSGLLPPARQANIYQMINTERWLISANSD